MSFVGCDKFGVAKMAKYKMEYWFEWGGTCLWSANDAAKKEFGYAVDEQKLPISAKLKNLLWYLQAYHENMMDIDNAPSDSPWWTEEDGIMFEKKKKFAYEQLCQELGEEFEIVYAD